MQINKITELIENFAPLEIQEDWDCSGWQIYFEKDIKKILLCLSITENIINQAVEKNCDMIISHHPLFFIPFGFNKNIPIYSAHTNLDKTDGGTTDALIEVLELSEAQKTSKGGFLRLVELKKKIQLEDFIELLKAKLNIDNLRGVNNLNKTKIYKIAFCAGSGADFIHEADKIGAQIFVTGDVKYHQALESNVIIIDVGHFESERPVLEAIKKLLKPLNLEVMEADEKSPFINY